VILLWDSSAMVCYYSLLFDDGRRVDYEWEAGRSLARDMLAHLRDSLAEHGARFDSLTGIGALEGPGSFTGLRIGITVLNTIAGDRDIPIVGARGDAWRSVALERLRNGESDAIVMPFYGGDAHVTQPRK